MKILIIRMYPDVLNINTYNCQEIGLAKALVRKNNVCDIVLYTNKAQYEEDIRFDHNTKSIHIYHLNAKSILRNAFYTKDLDEIVKKYDIVQSTEYDQIANVKLWNSLKDKLIIYHGPYISKYTKGYKKKCIISNLYYLINSSFKNVQCIAKSKLAENLLIKEGFKNIETIGVGLDCEKFEKKIIDSERIEKIIKEKGNFKYLLYVGKIEKRRNILYLINILKRLVEKKNEYKLIIVGKGNKDYIEKCKKYAIENNLMKNIIYLESMKQEELPNLYKCSDVFILPTHYEIFGMVILEAMYFGIPVITTLNGGSSELINNEKYGRICNLKNVDSWINAVEQLAMLNKDEKKDISEYIKNNFTWDKLSEKFIKIYKKINE